MKYFNQNINPALYYLGWSMLLLAIILGLYAPYNEHVVLGLNSVMKPIKFALSIWIYCWTFALLLPLWEDQKSVNRFTVLAVVTMIYEQTIITVQALRGKLSHFNQYEIVGGILYGLMGIMIVWVTVATLLMTFRFIKQKNSKLESVVRLSIIYGLLVFVIFSFWGGLMSGINSHQIGGEMGGEGIKFLNWSKHYGDLRIAHFLGIHALQVIPISGIVISKMDWNENRKITVIKIIGLLYTGLIVYTSINALLGRPFIL